ncbi:hypothetical protein EGT74_23705 [Chitinophaga lutea]|uniref:Right handed beta helix domain-containing protein n=1 Tax=Chitinophaga lutea TaxID=2488634 RepID=A0A3N4PBA7_9BACT|nr:right-handed parallel beta-helix repeat-containing protein [Chitinophaga lutea]RPE05395.1 hypothetical protein EGT74_23705 [Chitinophaga lutea]
MRKLLIILLSCISVAVSAQPFQHPGINQSAADLAHMKKLVLSGEEPYAGAYQRLKQSIDLQAPARPVTYVLRGPSGRPNIGAGELMGGAATAYNCALVWYISGDRAYAGKAIETLNAWSATLWDFDYNDAKLFAGLSGHVFCNAAEIMRHSNAGWKQADMDRFAGMLMNVYYPIIRYYYPSANGNWDGAIIHTIIAMGIYLDNREMFNNAIGHYLHGPLNGSLFKYIYPSGQCQESQRDQGHVQLGIGEFAGAAQIAYTQGVDLFSIAGNRLALGYEYTAGFLMGRTPHCYGTLSERVKELRDNFEAVYRHYAAHGMVLPYTKQAADSVRPKASRSVLTAVRAPQGKVTPQSPPTASTIGYIAGATDAPAIPAGALTVQPGENIQQALDGANGRWVVLKKGLHILPATLKIPSNITLAGEGVGTVLFLDTASGMREAMLNATPDLHDVTIRDLVIEVAQSAVPGRDPNGNRSHSRKAGNRAGIVFRTEKEGGMKNLQFNRVTIRNGTFNGLLISGATGIVINRCDFNENGSYIVPGPKLQHNVRLTHCSDIRMDDSRMAGSPHGSGIALDACTDVAVSKCEITRNAYYGVQVNACQKVSVTGCLIEGNDRSGVMLEFLHSGSESVTVKNNLIHYNGGFGVEAYAAKQLTVGGNTYAGNGKTAAQEKLSSDKYVVME